MLAHLLVAPGCGPLEIVDIATGKRRAITSRLVSIAGGDWRKGPAR